eukprot:29182-Pelagococcus_subviridis.AAC.2
MSSIGLSPALRSRNSRNCANPARDAMRLCDAYSRCVGRYAGGTASMIDNRLSTTDMRDFVGSNAHGASRRRALSDTGLARCRRTASTCWCR